jgi:hypothetical protein
LNSGAADGAEILLKQPQADGCFPGWAVFASFFSDSFFISAVISAVRNWFNQEYSEERYRALLQGLHHRFGQEVDFRIAESPVFVDRDLKSRLLEASSQIIDTLCRPDFRDLTERSIPPGKWVPGEDSHTRFLAIDFAISRNREGRLIPQLIELQGFPSLYAFQAVVSEAYQQHYSIPSSLSYLLSGLTAGSYRELLGRIILNGHPPEEVVLVDIEPWLQKTRIDFLAVEEFYGVRAVCISQLKRRGVNLFYDRDGREVPVRRIYNRVIFDELDQRPDLKTEFRLVEEADVEWAGHPNWFFRISKFSMPLLESPYVPETRYLSDFHGHFPTDTDNYVLKPLYSFAGTGVVYDLKPGDLEAVRNPENYILQKKIHYAPALVAPDGEGIKTEIRMLFLWPGGADRPIPCTSLVRLSKGIMMGVKFNQDKTWVGGSAAFFEPG